MFEVMQVVNETHGMIQAIGGLRVVEQVGFSDFFGIPGLIGEKTQYAFQYASGDASISGVCENVARELHCQTHMFDGKTATEVKDVIAMTTADVSKAVTYYCEEKIEQLHIAIYPGSSEPVKIINAFKMH